jgi:NAD(P)-dependent dehydrogenase (short-subunit alcohol dehydrogenase family)
MAVGSGDDMAGQVCLITGATSGLGLATATALASRGATVVVAGRSAAGCRAAVEHVARRTGNAQLDWLAADLSSQSQVRDLATALQRRHGRLHVLINNAGAVFGRRQLSGDGIEMTLAVNHLAPFLLTTSLAGTLEASAPARVVTVSSVAHERERLDLADLQLRRGYRPYRAYARSKLANLLFTYELARRMAGAGVSANAVNPGLVRTGIGTKAGRIGALAWALTLYRHRAVAVEPEHAAASIVHVAASADVDGQTGQYFENGLAVQSSPASQDPVAAARLWALSEQLTAPRPTSAR